MDPFWLAWKYFHFCSQNELHLFIIVTWDFISCLWTHNLWHMKMHWVYRCFHFRLHERTTSAKFRMEKRSPFAVAFLVSYELWPCHIRTAIAITLFATSLPLLCVWSLPRFKSNPDFFRVCISEASHRKLSISHVVVVGGGSTILWTAIVFQSQVWSIVIVNWIWQGYKT